jgi:hypothetical protein
MDRVRKRLTSDGRTFEPGELFDFAQTRNYSTMISTKYIEVYCGVVNTCKECKMDFDDARYKAHRQTCVDREKVGGHHKK